PVHRTDAVMHDRGVRASIARQPPERPVIESLDPAQLRLDLLAGAAVRPELAHLGLHEPRVAGPAIVEDAGARPRDGDPGLIRIAKGLGVANRPDADAVPDHADLAPIPP